jgi:hypothetical protein
VLAARLRPTSLSKPNEKVRRASGYRGSTIMDSGQSLHSAGSADIDLTSLTLGTEFCAGTPERVPSLACSGLAVDQLERQIRAEDRRAYGNCNRSICIT